MSKFHASQSCIEHSRTLIKYCKIHDMTICDDCLKINALHQNCSELISIEEAAKNTTQSTALADLEETIIESLESIEQLIHDRETEQENIQKEKENIEIVIRNTREHINKRLDEIEKKSLSELESKYDICKTKNTTVMKQFKKAHRELRTLNDSIIQMKLRSSDQHLFLATRQFNERVHEEIKTINMTAISAENYKFGITIHQFFCKFLKDSKKVEMFGEILVEEKTAGLQVKNASFKGAQSTISLSVPLIHGTRLSLKQKFKIKYTREEMSITGCAMAPDGNLLLANYNGTNVVMEYSETGQYIRNIDVSKSPFDLTVIKSDHLAITYGHNGQYTEILNISKRSEDKKIYFQNSCWGICHRDEKCYILIYGSRISVIDLLGVKLKTITLATSIVDYIAVTENRIFYTDYGNNSLHSCDMAGQEVWEFTDQSIKGPTGLAVDNNNHIFVASDQENKLTAVRQNGEASKILMNEADSLKNPRSIHYNFEKKVLIVCNEEDGDVAIYTIS